MAEERLPQEAHTRPFLFQTGVATTVLLKILLAIGCRSITTAERQTGIVMDSDVATHTVPVHQDRSVRVIVIDSGQAVSYSGRTRSIVRIVPIPAS